MALSLRDVQRDPIANRALNELMQQYTVAEEKSGLLLIRKAADMKLFLYDLDDLHQMDFARNQQMVREIERLIVGRLKRKRDPAFTGRAREACKDKPGPTPILPSG